MINKKYVALVAVFALCASLAAVAPTFAEGNDSQQKSDDSNGWQLGVHARVDVPGMPGKSGRPEGMMMRPGIFGTVSAVNGTTITVNARKGFASTSPATVTYTVDASSAKVFKNNATSTLSSVAVGDAVAIQGTVTGTNVVATTIRDGLMMRGPGMNGDKDDKNKDEDKDGSRKNNWMGTSSPFMGNGQPVIAGNISAISTTSLTVTTKSNVTYTVNVNASSTKIFQGKNSMVLSNLSVGDEVIIQGSVNGTSITASSIIDQKASQKPNPGAEHANPRSFFGGIGQFFKHLFGF